MSSATEPVMVVGVNGSLASAAALRWAAEEADRRHARLRVVLSWSPRSDASYAPADGQPTPEQQRQAAAETLTTQLRKVFGSALPRQVIAEVATGVAERVLIEESADADLLVLGSAAPPYSQARSVGPVVRTCLSRAPCPVVVISPAAVPGDPAREQPPELAAVPGA